MLMAACAWVILLSCLSIHYRCHFRFSFHIEPPTNVKSPNRSSLKLPLNRRSFGLQSRDGGHLAFFPLCFLFYTLLLLLLASVILVVDILQLILLHSQWTAFQLFFTSPSVSDLHDETSNALSTAISVADYILIYGMLVLSLWESLFSFYRHFTTMSTLDALEVPSTFRVLLLFSFYGVLFAALFLCSLHFYHYLSGVVVLTHFLFNLYCTWTFSAALISKYSADDCSGLRGREEILESVRFVRKASIASNAVQTLYLGTFLVSFALGSACYLPILWGVSCSVTMFNFIRNRQFVSSKCLCGVQKGPAPAPSTDDADMVSVIMAMGETRKVRPPATGTGPVSREPIASGTFEMRSMTDVIETYPRAGGGAPTGNDAERPREHLGLQCPDALLSVDTFFRLGLSSGMLEIDPALIQSLNLNGAEAGAEDAAQTR